VVLTIIKGYNMVKRYYSNGLDWYCVYGTHVSHLGKASGTWYRVDKLPPTAVAKPHKDFKRYVAYLVDEDVYWEDIAQDVFNHTPSAQDVVMEYRAATA